MDSPYLIAAIAFMVLFIIVGFWLSKKVKAIEDFYVAGRRIGYPFLTGALMSTWISASGLIGYSGMAWRFGPPASQLTWGFWGVALFGLLFAAPLNRFGRFTIPDFLSSRFASKRGIRGIVGTAYTIGFFGYLIGQLIGMGVIFEMCGIPYSWGIIASSVVLFLYIVLGGQLSIIFNDTIMTLIALLMAIVYVPAALSALGGWHALVIEAPKYNPQIWRAFGTEGFVWVFSMMLSWNLFQTTSPILTTIVYSGKNERAVLNALCTTVFLMIAFTWAIYLPAAASRAVFTTVDAFPGRNIDYVLPQITLKYLSPAIGAIVVGGMLSIVLSTADSIILVMSQALAHDICYSILKPTMSEENRVKLSRAFVAIVIALTAWASIVRPAEVWWMTAIGVSLIGGVITPVMISGMYWRRSTKLGALLGTAGGLLVSTVLTLLNFFKIYPFPFGFHAIFWGFLTTTILLILGSLATKPTDEELRVYDELKAKIRVSRLPKATAKDYMVPIAVIVASLAYASMLSYALLFFR